MIRQSLTRVASIRPQMAAEEHQRDPRKGAYTGHRPGCLLAPGGEKIVIES